MANYTHQGPGPSSYYQQSPPVYGGGHSPGPRPPNFYPYPPQFHQHHHPAPPPRGNHPRGSYGSRGYYQQQPAPYAAHYPAKYNPASYHYPSPNAPVFTPSWQQQQQQPVSPLPKQLSMPQPSAPITPQEPPTESEIPLPPPPQTPPPTSSSYSHMGSISTADESTQPISNPGIAKWAIWSRRPQDPTLAPGIIISPKARPPPDIVLQASHLKTPPPSPPPPRSPPLLPTKPPLLPSTPLINPIVDLSQQPLPADEAPGLAWASLTNSSVPSSSVTETTDTPTQAGSPASSHTSLSVASTKDGKDLGLNKEVGSMSAEEETLSNIPASAEKTMVVPSTSTALTPTPDVPPEPQVTPPPTATSVAPPLPPAPPKKSWASLLRPSTSSSSSSTSAGPSRNALPTSSVVGISIPAASAAVQDSSLQVSPSRRTELVRLLTSGPGVGHPTATTAGVSYASTTATTTTTTNLTPSTKIRPRGLINSGNMCFANSVLQIMVYCPPFHRLFAELGKVLGGVGLSGVPGTSGNGTSGNGTAAEASVYPLVEATVEFLREFVVEDDRSKDLKEKGKANANPNVNGKVPSASGSGSSSRTPSSRGGKGKERERGDSIHDANGEGGMVGRREDEDGGTESFLPTYVYDAMKVKKRFEHMRGGHQEDAEEFFGFYLDTLEEELLAMLAAVSAPPPSTPANTSSTNSAPGKNAKLGSVTGTGTGNAAAANAYTESESIVSHEDADGDGWLEVGKRNRTVVTRTIKGTESPITRIFGGKFRSTLRAPGQKDSVLVEDWRALRLDIQHDQIHTIQDALSYISHPQTVQITLPTQSQSQSQTHAQQKTVNAAQTQQQTINAQQQVLIEALPPVLVLHIKRFCYDKESGGVVKVGKRVRFSGELDIGSDVMVPAAKKSQPVRYKLFGVLYHHGMSASGGHYTLDVLHPDRYPASSLLSSSSGASYSSSLSTSDPPRASSAPATSTSTPSSREGWVRIDDDVVVDVRPEDVFGFGGDRERDEARCAYLLFYRRV